MHEVHPKGDEWLLYRTGDGGFDLIATFADKDDAEFCRRAFERRGGPRCCHIGCDRPATAYIQGPNGPEDYTHACDEHREELTGDDCTVWPIGAAIQVA